MRLLLLSVSCNCVEFRKCQWFVCMCDWQLIRLHLKHSLCFKKKMFYSKPLELRLCGHMFEWAWHVCSAWIKHFIPAASICLISSSIAHFHWLVLMMSLGLEFSWMPCDVQKGKLSEIQQRAVGLSHTTRTPSTTQFKKQLSECVLLGRWIDCF